MARSLCEVNVCAAVRTAGEVAEVGVPLRDAPLGGTLRAVDHTDRDELRRLALWLSRRRAVDEAVGVLTAYGPAASDRVHAHLDALRRLLESERDAFEALCAQAPLVPQLPLPDLVEAAMREGHASTGATVHRIGASRERHLS
jgi:hypothetical protein